MNSRSDFCVEREVKKVVRLSLGLLRSAVIMWLDCCQGDRPLYVIGNPNIGLPYRPITKGTAGREDACYTLTVSASL